MHPHSSISVILIHVLLNNSKYIIFYDIDFTHDVTAIIKLVFVVYMILLFFVHVFCNTLSAYERNYINICHW